MNCGTCPCLRRPSALRPLAKCDWYGAWLAERDGAARRCLKCMEAADICNPTPANLPELLRPQAI